MTGTRLHLVAPSANDLFKSNYNKYLRWSLLAAVALSALLVALSPRYTPTPYRLRMTEITVVDIEPPEIVIEPPQVAPPPVMPKEIRVAERGEPIDEPPIVWPPFDPPRRGPIYPSGDEGFVASSSKPVLVAQPKPHYPEVARLAQVEGTVVVKVLVDVDGTVMAAEIVQGSHTLLNNAALKAARQCRFTPGRQREIAVPTWVAVPYNFRLH